MDNKFVPNLTWNFEAAEKIIRNSSLPVDATDELKILISQGPRYAEVGCKSVTVHYEATTKLKQTLQSIRRAGARAAVGIKPKTDLSVLIEYRELIDMILIMTVEPGFGGQKFMANMMDKVTKSREFIG
jgi:ribulose-phosphate 3-epimerase